jgi:hypothetical protein
VKLPQMPCRFIGIGRRSRVSAGPQWNRRVRPLLTFLALMGQARADAR